MSELKIPDKLMYPVMVFNFGPEENPLTIRGNYRVNIGNPPDEGPSICFYNGAYNDERIDEFLRMDLFENDPHYHYHPGIDGANIKWIPGVSDPKIVLKQLLENIGFPQLAKNANEEAIASYFTEEEKSKSIDSTCWHIYQIFNNKRLHEI